MFALLLQAPPTDSWNGDLLGYQVWYNQLQSSHTTRTRRTRDTESNGYEPVTVTFPITQVELTNLVADVYYEFQVNAFNGKGHGPLSAPVDVYVGEAGKIQSWD